MASFALFTQKAGKSDTLNFVELRTEDVVLYSRRFRVHLTYESVHCLLKKHFYVTIMCSSADLT